MRAAHGWVLALLAVALLCGSPVWADSTLHIGTGVGTTCQSGCAGDPNLIGSGSNFDIAQVSEDPSGGIASVTLVLAVPGNQPSLTTMTVNGATGTFQGFDNSTDIYTFLGDTSLNNSNNLTNLEGADCSQASLCSVTGYSIYTFSVGSISPSGFIGLSGSGIPLGTFAVALGTESSGKLDGTPFTEAGLTTGPGGPVSTPEPGTLALLGGGLLAMGGIVRRRFFNS